MASSGVVPSQLPPYNSNPLLTVLPLQVFPSVRPQPVWNYRSQSCSHCLLTSIPHPTSLLVSLVPLPSSWIHHSLQNELGSLTIQVQSHR